MPQQQQPNKDARKRCGVCAACQEPWSRFTRQKPCELLSAKYRAAQARARAARAAAADDGDLEEMEHDGFDENTKELGAVAGLTAELIAAKGNDRWTDLSGEVHYADTVGLYYKLSSVDPQLESAWFQLLSV
jgi:hypothetical protein